VRGAGSSLEVVWSLDVVRAFIMARHGMQDPPTAF
jgi:hypothetical protein